MIICEIKQLKQVPSSTTPMIGGGSYRAPVQATVSFLIRHLQICSTLISIRGKGRAELVYCPSTPEGTQQLGLTLWRVDFISSSYQRADLRFKIVFKQV
ncbi:hypothetical protein OUZ56_011050 [Daphnia magna]|uniref:Uncharacterized protein n=1 Tax=Daphnia magna TaxID=35525 RepID=A0ABQ9YZ51_9CRUS|nr:hypothetical protein OUZ56_011050 [Daphnia magna]